MTRIDKLYFDRTPEKYPKSVNTGIDERKDCPSGKANSRRISS